jgi:hypothetical protein
VRARVALANGNLLTACSFHGRPGADPPAAALRAAFHTGIAEWLARVPGPVVFGLDVNAPTDPADALLGADPVHTLRLVLRAGEDHLWATSDFEVLDVQCVADEAAMAGSDHPLLLTELKLHVS